MLKLHHEDTLKYYVNKFKIEDIFKIDFTRNMELHCFNKDELIACECSNPCYLYFLVEGKINKIDNLNNYSKTISTNNFNIIGALEIFTNCSFNYTLKAIEDCICIGVSRSIIENVAFENVSFLKHFCCLFSNEISKNNLPTIFFEKEKDAI